MVGETKAVVSRPWKGSRKPGQCVPLRDCIVYGVVVGTGDSGRRSRTLRKTEFCAGLSWELLRYSLGLAVTHRGAYCLRHTF